MVSIHKIRNFFKNYLVHRRRREIFAIEVCCHNYTTGRVWILGRDHICESFPAIRCIVLELVFFNMPVQIAQRSYDMFTDEGIVVSIRWQNLNIN
jgi:hypothetical protein